MKGFRVVVLGLSISIIGAIAACSGGSDSPASTPVPPPDLTGEYYGAYYNALTGGVVELSMSISGNKITAIDGQDLSPSITINHGGIRGVTYTGVNDNGDVGGLTVSSDGKYLAYVVSDGVSDYSEVAILEKGASSYASFNQQSFMGSWSGLQYKLNADMDIVGFGNGNTSTAADGSFTGHGADGTYNSTVNVTLDASYGNLGFATASMSTTAATGLDVKTLLSPDGKAAATWVCASGSSAFSTCGFSMLEKSNTLIGVEMADPAPGAINTAPARNLEFALGEFSNGAIDCTLVRPYQAATCTASYDTTTHVADLTISGTTYQVDLSATSITMPVTIVGQSDTGTARFVQPRLHVRTQRHHTGYDYTVVVLANPDPSFRKAILTGANGSAIQLWNNDFGNAYDSYYQDNIDDGIPAGTASYVSINSSAAHGKYRSGLYKVVLSDNPGQPNRSISYYYNYDGATAANLLVSEPHVRANIMINGQGMVNAKYTNPATITSAPGYTISWSDNATDSANTLWQVRFRVVNNGSSNHLKNREYRSKRVLANSGGLTLTAGIYSWTAPQAFTSWLNEGDVVKVQIRASNVENTLAAQTQGAFVCPDSVAQTGANPSCVFPPALSVQPLSSVAQ